MKYKAVVWRTRNGCKCNLYVKLIIWIPIEFVRWYGGSVPDDISFLITEKLDEWSSYYGNNLVVVDPRPNPRKGYKK